MSLGRSRLIGGGKGHREQVSAWIDGELGPIDARQLEQKASRDPSFAVGAERDRRVSALVRESAMPSPDTASVGRSAERVYTQLQASIAQSHRGASRPRWIERRLEISYPIAAVAAIALAFVGGMTLALAGSRPSASATVADVARQAEHLNLQLTIDGAETEHILEWLNEQDALDTVTIELPEAAEFELRGEPVLLRPSDLRFEPLKETELDG